MISSNTSPAFPPHAGNPGLKPAVRRSPAFPGRGVCGLGLALACYLALCVTSVGSDLDQARVSLEKWVEARQLAGKAKADWQLERESLESGIRLFERELAGIQEQMQKVGTNATQVTLEQAQTDAQIKEAGRALDRVQQICAELEKEIRSLEPRLPAPLQDTLKPLLNRMPAEGAPTKLTAAERFQIVVLAFNELDKFNSTLTIANERRQAASGEEVAVEVLYLGLGAAYFVNDTGSFAGTGTPGAQAWDWTVRPDIASAVRDCIRIYRNEKGARFVTLPATLR